MAYATPSGGAAVLLRERGLIITVHGRGTYVA
jgi:DNA-binding GntR family transcriptional regulator